MKAITSIEVKDGCSVMRMRLQYGAPTESWRMAIATRVFRFGAWIIGARIRINTEIRDA